MKKDAKQKLSRRLSFGTCALCEASGIPKRSITKHLTQCPKRAIDLAGHKRALHLMAWFPYDPRYWIHFEALESVDLRMLDAFLRDLWLECCGHMSAFTIAQQRYIAPSQGVMREYGDRSMDVPLKDILLPGMRFLHEYDFGSTTELMLEVVAHNAAQAKPGSAVQLLARNDPLDFRCRVCKHPAATICLECQEEAEEPEDIEQIYYCDQCIENRTEHTHDDESLRLPIVNSPRMGVCGYE